MENMPDEFGEHYNYYRYATRKERKFIDKNDSISVTYTFTVSSLWIVSKQF